MNNLFSSEHGNQADRSESSQEGRERARTACSAWEGAWFSNASLQLFGPTFKRSQIDDKQVRSRSASVMQGRRKGKRGRIRASVGHQSHDANCLGTDALSALPAFGARSIRPSLALVVGESRLVVPSIRGAGIGDPIAGLLLIVRVGRVRCRRQRRLAGLTLDRCRMVARLFLLVVHLPLLTWDLRTTGPTLVGQAFQPDGQARKPDLRHGRSRSPERTNSFSMQLPYPPHPQRRLSKAN
jgi:hypothetical protein